jgi:hypothetical protein
MSLDRRISRLEQSHPWLTGDPDIVIETVSLDPARPELGSFEIRYQYGVKIYDGIADMLNQISGKTRSL